MRDYAFDSFLFEEEVIERPEELYPPEWRYSFEPMTMGFFMKDTARKIRDALNTAYREAVRRVRVVPEAITRAAKEVAKKVKEVMAKLAELKKGFERASTEKARAMAAFEKLKRGHAENLARAERARRPARVARSGFQIGRVGAAREKVAAAEARVRKAVARIEQIHGRLRAIAPKIAKAESELGIQAKRLEGVRTKAIAEEKRAAEVAWLASQKVTAKLKGLRPPAIPPARPQVRPPARPQVRPPARPPVVRRSESEMGFVAPVVLLGIGALIAAVAEVARAFSKQREVIESLARENEALAVALAEAEKERMAAEEALAAAQAELMAAEREAMRIEEERAREEARIETPEVPIEEWAEIEPMPPTEEPTVIEEVPEVPAGIEEELGGDYLS